MVGRAVQPGPWKIATFQSLLCSAFLDGLFSLLPTGWLSHAGTKEECARGPIPRPTSKPAPNARRVAFDTTFRTHSCDIRACKSPATSGSRAIKRGLLGWKQAVAKVVARRKGESRAPVSTLTLASRRSAFPASAPFGECGSRCPAPIFCGAGRPETPGLSNRQWVEPPDRAPAEKLF